MVNLGLPIGYVQQTIIGALSEWFEQVSLELVSFRPFGSFELILLRLSLFHILLFLISFVMRLPGDIGWLQLINRVSESTICWRNQMFHRLKSKQGDTEVQGN